MKTIEIAVRFNAEVEDDQPIDGICLDLKLKNVKLMDSAKGEIKGKINEYETMCVDFVPSE